MYSALYTIKYTVVIGKYTVVNRKHWKIYSGHQERLENIQWSPGNIRKYTVVTRKHWKNYRLFSSFVFLKGVTGSVR